MPNTSSASSTSLMSEVEEVEGPQEENIDYSTMTVVQLKEIAKRIESGCFWRMAPEEGISILL